MAGRPRKPLEELVWERTFVARRHADRLAGEPLVDEQRLRLLQERYRDEPSTAERRLLAAAFERVVRDPLAAPLEVEQGWEVDEARDYVSRADREAMEAELEELLHAQPVLVDPDVGRARSERFARGLLCRDLRQDGDSFAAIAVRVGVSAKTVRRLIAEVTA